jgi:hypothetical protein
MPIRGPTPTSLWHRRASRFECRGNIALASAGGLTGLLAYVTGLWLLPLLTGLLIAVGRLLLLLLIARLLAGVRRLLVLLRTGLHAARRRLLILLITVRRILILLHLLRTEQWIGVWLRPRLLADRRRLLTEQNFKEVEGRDWVRVTVVRRGRCARRRISCCVLDCSGCFNVSGMS